MHSELQRCSWPFSSAGRQPPTSICRGSHQLHIQRQPAWGSWAFKQRPQHKIYWSESCTAAGHVGISTRHLKLRQGRPESIMPSIFCLQPHMCLESAVPPQDRNTCVHATLNDPGIILHVQMMFHPYHEAVCMSSINMLCCKAGLQMMLGKGLQPLSPDKSTNCRRP